MIHEIVSAAFGRQDEARLVDALRADGVVAVELVALQDDVPVGHILFSRCTLEPDTIRVAGLAPVAISPGRQNAGVGSALIREGLARCQAASFDAVVLLGDPAWYRRFGFTHHAARVFDCAYAGPAFQALELRDDALAGGPWRLSYPRAFEALD